MAWPSGCGARRMMSRMMRTNAPWLRTDAPIALPSRFSCCSNMKRTSPGREFGRTYKCPCAGVGSGLLCGGVVDITAECVWPIFTELVETPQLQNGYLNNVAETVVFP